MGVPNRPAYLVDTAELVAELRGISLEQLADQERANAITLFQKMKGSRPALATDELTDPADPQQLASLLRRHGITLQHRLGQNFLIDPALRDAVADSAGTDARDEVLEVGAGAGTLTIALAARCRRLVAVEFDRALIPALREVVAGHDKIEVVQAGLLRYDGAGGFPNGGEVVAGNIPYNLTRSEERRVGKE